MRVYRERLWPTPFVFVACALVIPAAIIVFLPINATVGIALAIAMYLAIVVLLLATSPLVEVADGELRAGRARLPLDAVGEVTGYRGTAATAQRGVELDARAWLLLRGWVDPVVRIVLTDDDDPTPYWLVSTRHPERLAAALDQPAA
jgi:hypothetical protein